jgi:multiple sugar transport system substrate-binding protein
MQRKYATLIVFSLLGCHGTLPPPLPPPHQGAVLRIDCPAPLRELIHSQSSAWQARQQARVEIVQPGQPADVSIIPPASLPALASRGKLTPLPDALRERGNPFEWTSLLPVYREQLLLWDGTPFAVPLLGESPVCLYRVDLFASAEHQEKFRAFLQEHPSAPALRELRAPTTWQEFALIAEYFRQHLAPGKPSPSLPPLPADDAALDRLFYTVAAPFARRSIRQERAVFIGQRTSEFVDEVFSFHYDLKTGKPLIDTAGFVAALEMLHRLQACRPDRETAHPEKAFCDGNAVLCITDARTLLDVQRSAALRDKVGICPVPGSDHFFTPSGEKKVPKEGINRVPYLGGAGWLAVVPSSAANSEAAFDLLADLAGPTRSTQIVLDPRFGGGPIRAEQVLRERWDSFDLDPDRSLSLKDALTATLLHGLENPVLCLRLPDAGPQREALVRELRGALKPKGDARAALKAVARRWSEMNAKKGAAAHLRELRLSLGLRGN